MPIGFDLYKHAKRAFDVILSMAILSVMAMPMVVISLLVRLTSKGQIIYYSVRVGRNNIAFTMPKFRTMHIGAPIVATHLLRQPSSHITRIGSILRRTSLDELPQLWSVLKGEMSLVGPRPALFNQDDLIYLRTQMGVHRLLPGVTGWAQVNGRDELTIQKKVQFDVEYLLHQSFFFDLKILWLTAFRVFFRKGVSH